MSPTKKRKRGSGDKKRDKSARYELYRNHLAKQIAISKVRNEQNRNRETRKWSKHFTLYEDGFFFIKLTNEILADIMAKYSTVTQFQGESTENTHQYFGTDAAARGSGRFMTSIALNKQSHHSLDSLAGTTTIPESTQLLRTLANIGQQLVHLDHPIGPKGMKAIADRKIAIGFIVIPTTASGTALAIARASHKFKFDKNAKKQIEVTDVNELTHVTCPLGWALVCAEALVHAGMATPGDQPADGRPRIHVYCSAGQTKTNPVKHAMNWPILPALEMSREKPATHHACRLLPKV